VENDERMHAEIAFACHPEFDSRAGAALREASDATTSGASLLSYKSHEDENEIHFQDNTIGTSGY
jgi:hypothetical protein